MSLAGPCRTLPGFAGVAGLAGPAGLRRAQDPGCQTSAAGGGAGQAPGIVGGCPGRQLRGPPSASAADSGSQARGPGRGLPRAAGHCAQPGTEMPSTARDGSTVGDMSARSLSGLFSALGRLADKGVMRDEDTSAVKPSSRQAETSPRRKSGARGGYGLQGCGGD